MRVTFYYQDGSIRILQPSELFFQKTLDGLKDTFKKFIANGENCYKIELLTNDVIEILYEKDSAKPVVPVKFNPKTLRKIKEEAKRVIKEFKKTGINRTFTYSSKGGVLRNFQEEREKKKAYKNRFKVAA